MLCWIGDRIQFKFINLLVNPILKVWKKWIEFWGGWLIFHSWNIYHIFQSISRAVHSSYRSIKWYGGRGIFNQGLAAPPAKLPAILSVLKGLKGEFSLNKITPVVLWIAPPQKYLNPHRHSYPNFESNEWKRFLFASAERHSTDSFMFHNCNGEQRGHFIININNTRAKIIRHSFCK